MGIISGLLGRWFSFFENWGFLKAIFDRHFLWLPDSVTAALPFYTAVFLLVAIPCHVLTVLTHRDDPEEQLKDLLVVGGMTAVVLVILRFFTTGGMDVIAWTFGGIVEAFTSIGQGNVVLDVLNALAMLVVGVINIALHSLFILVPAAIIVIGALSERETYGAWTPIAVVGHVGVGFLLVAAITGGFLGLVMFAIWCMGPFFAWMLHM